jgi:hypothetical protein
VTLTRKDFEAIADQLKAGWPLCEDHAQRHGYRLACWAAAEALARTNDNFNPERFVSACEPTPTVK